ncbi:MAG TPA: hypothetical protein VF790_02240, partial [Dissulfurispiraceae bacterium]
MSWACKKEVLGAFRMLTEREAFLRKIALSCGAGWLISACAVLSSVSAHMVLFGVLAGLYFVVSESFHKSIFGTWRNDDTGPHTNTECAKAEDEKPVFVLDKPEANETGFIRIVKTPFMREAIRISCMVFFALVFSYGIHWLYETALLAPLFILISGSVYLLMNHLLEAIGRREFAEFPSVFKEKLMLNFYHRF